MNKKQEIIRGHLTCTCDEAYKSRNMTDPNCFLCEYESEIELMMDEYSEQQLKNCNLQNVSGSLHIDFAVYLTGHDKETIEQMYNDWRQ